MVFAQVVYATLCGALAIIITMRSLCYAIDSRTYEAAQPSLNSDRVDPQPASIDRYRATVRTGPDAEERTKHISDIPIRTNGSIMKPV